MFGDMGWILMFLGGFKLLICITWILLEWDSKNGNLNEIKDKGFLRILAWIGATQYSTGFVILIINIILSYIKLCS